MSSKELCCEIKVLQAKDIQPKSNGTYFVRYYVSAANNKRIQINTKEITMSSSSNLYWNESICLECSPTKDNIQTLKEDSIVLELRWRSNTTNPIRRQSKLVGSAEIPWKSVFESPKMEMEKWVTMSSNKKINSASVRDESVEAPSVQICMRVQVPELMEENKRSKRSEEYECGCYERRNIYCKCQDYEIFALVGAFEVAL